MVPSRKLVSMYKTEIAVKLVSEEGFPGSKGWTQITNFHGEPVLEDLTAHQCFLWFPAMKSIAGARGEEERKNVIQQLEEGLGLLENAYKTISEGKPFFGGDRIGYLDIALGCFLGWLRVTEISHGLKLLDHSKTPLLAQWAQRFCADDTVKNVMPETEKLLEFAKIIRAKLAVASASN
ncbi:glutathione S-transferase U17-like [Senna tora]|uniref:glutathione transferase n=1 Tax=Senna tora TaxID=362788 RepID=A0A834STM8_9FABA|nr:glutathione S-transferase U17-like [Senna tora]